MERKRFLPSFNQGAGFGHTPTTSPLLRVTPSRGAEKVSKENAFVLKNGGCVSAHRDARGVYQKQTFAKTVRYTLPLSPTLHDQVP